MKLLLVDDDELFRKRLSLAFLDRGFEVIESSSCQSAKEAIKQMPDYAVVDLRIPDGNGLDLLTDLRETAPNCRVVILTGFGTIATAVHALKAGAEHYLTKPVNADDILAAFEIGETNKPGEKNEKEVPLPTLNQIEWDHIQRVINECSGNISHASKKLGLHRRSLQRKLLKQPGKLR